MSNPEDALKQVNRSGFPFQLRVEHEVRTTEQDHHWQVENREHPWGHPETKSSGFIDLVLRHMDYVTFRLVMECKRIKADDARQLRWVFLLPDQESRQTSLASCLEVEGRRIKSADSVWEDVRIWDNVDVSPASLQSEFCILPNDEQRRQSILESLAGELLESIEGLAQEEVNVEKSQSPSSHLQLFIFPVIVTNAALAVCRFKSSDINIADGTLSPNEAEIEEVPFIRFRKSLATDFPQGSYFNLKSASRARERTIFVVNATSLPVFLRNWKVEPRSLTGLYAFQEISRYRELLETTPFSRRRSFTHRSTTARR